MPRINLGALVAGALLVAIFAAAASAQEAAKTDKELLLEQRKLQIFAGSVHREGTLPATDKAREDFQRFHLITLRRFVLPENRAQLPDIRKAYIERNLVYSSKAANKEVHDELNRTFLDELQQITFDPQHDEVVRYNAMLQVAELNEVEYSVRREATPLPATLPVLVRAWKQADLGESVRVAALLGIRRHAESGIADAELRNTVQTEMLAALADEQVPSTRSPEAHDWVRELAVRTLGALGSPTTQAEVSVAQRLLEVVRDGEESMFLRCAAAEMLGRLDYSGARNLNFKLLGHGLGALAAEVAADPGNKRRQRHYLGCALVGLAGPAADEKNLQGLIAAASNPEHKQYLTEIFSRMNAVNAVFDDRKLTDDELPEKVQEVGDTLEQWLQANPPESQTLSAR